MPSNLFRSPDGHLVQLLHRAVDSSSKVPCVVYRRFPDGPGVFVVAEAMWKRCFRQAGAEPESEEASTPAVVCSLIGCFYVEQLPRPTENRG